MTYFTEILLEATPVEGQQPSNLAINRLDIYPNGRVDALCENEWGQTFFGEEYKLQKYRAEAICAGRSKVSIYRD